MSSDVSNFLYGAVAGGVVALILRVVETYWLGPRLVASREAREKLLLYSRHLYFSCGQAEFRLKYIGQKMREKRPGGIASLKLSLKEAKSLQWFTKEGYYVTSTAYLIALVACWIVTLQRDVVFLPFKRKADMSLANCYFARDSSGFRLDVTMLTFDRLTREASLRFIFLNVADFKGLTRIGFSEGTTSS
jgi:hypothetical protein